LQLTARWYVSQLILFLLNADRAPQLEASVRLFT
jgi:hypothetical protein